MAGDVVERELLDGHVLLLDPLQVVVGTGRRSVARKTRTRSSLKPGELWNSAQQLEPAGREADLLGQLAAGGLLGRLAVDVADAGRDLEQQPVERGPVLAHQRHPAVVEQRHHRDRARMVHDVALEGGAVGTREGADGQRDDLALVDRPLGDAGEPATLRRSAARAADRSRRRGGLALELDEVRVAALGPGQRGADELAEQRRRAGSVGS